MRKKRESHGQRYSITYTSWRGMWDRCSNENATNYKHYGMKGISVCDRWMSFFAFLEDMGERPSRKHTIDRINGSLGYSKSNCRWATQTTQMRNTSRSRRLLHDGITMSLVEWSQKTGIPRDVITNRLDRGWPIVAALTTPVRPCGSSRTIYVMHDGRSQSLHAWAKELGMSYSTLSRWNRSGRYGDFLISHAKSCCEVRP